MDIIQSVQHAGKTVNLYVDPDPISPYEEDTLTQISHWHRRYDLGSQVESGITAEEMIEQAKERGDPILAILPLFLFDHSGISVSTRAFSCRWDSGQVGWVYITQSRSDMMGCQGWSNEQYEKAIRGDIQTFDFYLTGSVYGYEVKGRDGMATISIPAGASMTRKTVSAKGREPPNTRRIPPILEQRKNCPGELPTLLYKDSSFMVDRRSKINESTMRIPSLNSHAVRLTEEMGPLICW